MKEKCGVYGICSKTHDKSIINEAINGLTSLQHRGQEGCGLVYLDSYNNYNLIKGLGLVKNIFNKNNLYIASSMVIGHVRYSTSGNTKKDINSLYEECQPLYGNCNLGSFYIVHNGNIPNVNIHDTKYIIQYLENDSSTTWKQKLIQLLENIPCAYCLLIMTKDGMYAIRDKYGIRPLCIGENQEKICISTESCALNNYTHLRDVRSGEIVYFYENSIKSLYLSQTGKLCICSFEFIYFSNINSFCDNYSVKEVRHNLAIKLAKKENLNNMNDCIVIGVPSTGIYYGKVYSNHLNLKYFQYIQKNENINRTFILPSEEERTRACLEKFSYDNLNLNNKKVIIVDDSIVRGNVISNIAKQLWSCKVKEIHVRITSPPVVNRCSLGIDISSTSELIAFNRTNEEIRKKINVNSLIYLSLDDINGLLPEHSNKECFGEILDPQMLLKNHHNNARKS